MNVIVLAAGTGSRLGERTRDVPKPAVPVAGRPLLGYTVAFARRVGAARVAVVLGFKNEVSEPLARDLGVDAVLYNAAFADAGNLISLGVARDAGQCDDGFLIMNSDHIYHPAIADKVKAAAAAATWVTAFIDRDRTLGADDMKVRLDDEQHVVSIDKQLESWDAGYVGMTFVPRAAVASYFRHADNVRLEKGDGIHVEQVLYRMVGVEPAVTVDISGPGWLEVDDERDLARAHAALAQDPWYAP
ncbi:MAG TPA: NTP transferase domain-containing protein [Haliangiales bacterium]|nr:NTP transferase domain-containing protein [Haliangiales bacterium]